MGRNLSVAEVQALTLRLCLSYEQQKGDKPLLRLLTVLGLTLG